MLIDTLSFLATNPEGTGFNDIARYLARRGFEPLHGAKASSSEGDSSLHPQTLTRLLKNAADNGFIKSDHSLGDCPKGQKNNFYLTKKGRSYFAKREEIRFIEDSDPEEVTVSSKVLKEKFASGENQLGKESLNFSKTLGLADQLKTPEDMFFADINMKIWTTTLQSESKIKLFVPRGSKHTPLTDEQIEQLSFILVASAGGAQGFRIVLSYDPLHRNLESNPKLLDKLLALEGSSFIRWLSDFKQVKIDEKLFEIWHNGASQEHDNKLEKESKQLEAYNAEFRAKREKTDKIMHEIRQDQSDFDEETDRTRCQIKDLHLSNKEDMNNEKSEE
jgi:DNA-binding MarR family transcriptional regulator